MTLPFELQRYDALIDVLVDALVREVQGEEGERNDQDVNEAISRFSAKKKGGTHLGCGTGCRDFL